MPSITPDSKDNILNIIRIIKEANKINTGSSILGIHLEGPFVNKDRKGAMNPDYMVSPTEDLVLDILKEGAGFVKMMTVAPEVKNVKKIIRLLNERNIIVSIGHSNATYEQLMDAVGAGATQITHLFNAMSELHHREPGISGGSLVFDRLKVQLIADGIHVNPAIIKLVIRTKGTDKILLISDAMRATDLGNGTYMSAGLKVIVKDGIARLEDGSLAGSTLTMDKAVRNLVGWGLASISDAIKMASYNPAESIGLSNKKGSIEKGKDADIIVLNNNLIVMASIISGEIVYHN